MQYLYQTEVSTSMIFPKWLMIVFALFVFSFPFSVFAGTVVDFNVSTVGFARKNSGGESWSSIRDGSGTNAFLNEVETDISSGSVTDEWTYLARGIFIFDTSSLPDDAVITSSTFRFQGAGSPSSDDFVDSINLTTVQTVTDNNIVSADYAIANYGSSRLSSDLEVADISVSDWNNFLLNSTGRSVISQEGFTKISTRLSADIDDVEPTWVSSGSSGFYSAGTPIGILSVEYEIPVVINETKIATNLFIILISPILFSLIFLKLAKIIVQIFRVK